MCIWPVRRLEKWLFRGLEAVLEGGGVFGNPSSDMPLSGFGVDSEL